MKVEQPEDEKLRITILRTNRHLQEQQISNQYFKNYLLQKPIKIRFRN